MNSYEKISLIISSIGLVSLFLIWWQIKSTQAQMQADHERSRRQVAIDLMMKWIDSLSSTDTGSSRKIVESLDHENCQKIYNIEKARIPESQKTLLEGVLGETNLTINSGYFEITDYQSSIIRGSVLTYLNSLEIVLSGWRLGISDKAIIEEEFSYLYDKEKKKGVLHNFRHIAGVHSYPSISAFCDCLSKKYNPEIEVKSNVA